MLFKKIPALLLFLTWSIWSCGVAPKSADEELTIKKPIDVEEGILFINLLFKGKEEDYSVFVNSAELTPGSLKRGIPHNGEIAVILSGPKTSDSIFVDNPLHGHFEEYSENGEIKRIQVQLEEAEIYIRMEYDGAYDRLIIRDMEKEINKYVCAIR